MEKQLDQPSVARVTLENEMDYTDLIERLNNLVILDEVRSDNRLGKEAADAIEALVKEREQLAALRKQIDALQPVAWLYYERGEECFGHPDGYRPDDAVALYTLEGIKK